MASDFGAIWTNTAHAPVYDRYTIELTSVIVRLMATALDKSSIDSSLVRNAFDVSFSSDSFLLVLFFLFIPFY